MCFELKTPRWLGVGEERGMQPVTTPAGAASIVFRNSAVDVSSFEPAA